MKTHTIKAIAFLALAVTALFLGGCAADNAQGGAQGGISASGSAGGHVSGSR